jgi:16S rRNA (uracil1498-N3)-methyltransferase
MNLPYFYESIITTPTHNLSAETSRHCTRVLRMKEGEKLQLTDGKGNLFTARIININNKNSEVKIETTTHNAKRQTPNISIAISLLKNPSRLEWFMEKVTEIGVAGIMPLICEHTEKENFRYDRMNSILISAMLQSRQTWLPQLHEPKKFGSFISEPFNGLKLIAHCGDTEKKSIVNVTAPAANALILIGPEGDFSKTEVEAAIKMQFIPVSLGNTRLRSETAGITAAILLNDFAHTV